MMSIHIAIQSISFYYLTTPAVALASSAHTHTHTRLLSSRAITSEIYIDTTIVVVRSNVLVDQTYMYCVILIFRAMLQWPKKKTIYNPSSLMNRSLSQCLFCFFNLAATRFPHRWRPRKGRRLRRLKKPTRFVYPVVALAASPLGLIRMSQTSTSCGEGKLGRSGSWRCMHAAEGLRLCLCPSERK